MGINVDDGFVYFNEMLYRVMRGQFGQVRYNKTMAWNELVTQYAITELTLQAKESSSVKKEVKETAFFGSRGQGSNISNPFLLMIFFRTSF